MEDFTTEIVGSHVLEWDDNVVIEGLDCAYWTFDAYLSNGERFTRWSSMEAYRYNYLKLEKVFVRVEADLRMGGLEHIYHLEELPLEEYWDIETAIKKYPEEFKHLNGKTIRYKPGDYDLVILPTEGKP
ncbi:MAG: hypothetical protein MJZ38_02170 [archaeon]|nr:hypothetical protein [archaeon]